MRAMATLVLCLVVPASCVQSPPPAWMIERELEPAEPVAAALPKWQEIGRSARGRSIRYRKVGTGHRCVLWIGGIHGNETEGVVATRELPAAFLAAKGMSSRVTLHIVEDMNPDGRDAQQRGNSRGVDLNRDFPASNRKRGRGLSQPESRVIHDLILKLQPDLVMVAHSWRDRFFINFDGPARRSARLFHEHSNFPVVPSSSIASTPGSMGSWCGWDMAIPILTVEWRRGTPPELAWEDTREAILAVTRGE
jgi:murein peptide amidase A